MIDWNDPPKFIKDLVRKTPNEIVYDLDKPIDQISVLRKVIPYLIAHEIVGVAPMVSPKPRSEWWVNNDHLYYLWEDPIV